MCFFYVNPKYILGYGTVFFSLKYSFLVVSREAYGVLYHHLLEYLPQSRTPAIIEMCKLATTIPDAFPELIKSTLCKVGSHYLSFLIIYKSDSIWACS